MKQFSADDELADIAPRTQTQPAPQTQSAPSPIALGTAPAASGPASAPAAAPPPPPAAQTFAQPDIDDDLPTGGQQQATSGKTSAQGDLVGEEVSWEDEELAKTGDGLQRIRPEKGSNKVSRFALLDFLPVGWKYPTRTARNHYVPTKEGKRCHICLGTRENPYGYCCKQLDEEGQTHIVCLALEYTNANPTSGNYDKNPATGQYPPIEYHIGFLDLSTAQYKQIKDLKEEDKSIYDVDLVMARDGNRYKFAVKSSKAARWKLIPGLAKDVEAKCQPFLQDGGRKLTRRLGKKTSLLEWKALLAGAAAGAQEANLSNMDDL